MPFQQQFCLPPQPCICGGQNVNVTCDCGNVMVDLKDDVSVRSMAADVTLIKEINHPSTGSNVNVYGGTPTGPLGARLVQNGAVYRLCYVTQSANAIPALHFSDTTMNVDDKTVTGVVNSLLAGSISVALADVPGTVSNDPRYVDGSISTNVDSVAGPAYSLIIQGVVVSGTTATFNVKMGIVGTVTIGSKVSIASSPYVVSNEHPLTPPTNNIPIGTLMEGTANQKRWVQTYGQGVMRCRGAAVAPGNMLTPDYTIGPSGGVQPLVAPAAGQPMPPRVGYALTAATANQFFSAFIQLE